MKTDTDISEIEQRTKNQSHTAPTTQVLIKVSKTYSGENTACLTNGVRETGQPCVDK